MCQAPFLPFLHILFTAFITIRRGRHSTVISMLQEVEEAQKWLNHMGKWKLHAPKGVAVAGHRAECFYEWSCVLMTEKRYLL
jgi:hypothetical protein